MKLSNVTFDSKYIYAIDESGYKLKQSLLWYPALMNASEEQRNDYETGLTGFHWRNLDEDVSFESFEYDDAVHMSVHPGELVKDEIEARGISQKKLAEIMGVPYTMLNEILNGKRN